MTLRLAIVLAVFFTSGCVALVYQVIWQRMLAMFSGADVYSATVIVAAFMGGLGVGHLAGGHVADRVSRRTSLVLFGVAEAAITARLADPRVGEYYGRAGIDIEQLMRPYLESDPVRYGPDFDREAFTDFNTDLFPKDEYDLSPPPR